MNETGPPERRMDKKLVSEVCVAGDVQFKRASFDKVPVHDDAHTAVVPRRHNAYQQDASFGRPEDGIT